jgi:hypothetical protein
MFGPSKTKRYFKIHAISGSGSAADELAMCYYKHEGAKEPNGWFFLKDITAICDESNTIIIRHPVRDFNLLAPTLADHSVWMQGLISLATDAEYIKDGEVVRKRSSSMVPNHDDAAEEKEDDANPAGEEEGWAGGGDDDDFRRGPDEGVSDNDLTRAERAQRRAERRASRRGGAPGDEAGGPRDPADDHRRSKEREIGDATSDRVNAAILNGGQKKVPFVPVSTNYDEEAQRAAEERYMQQQAAREERKEEDESMVDDEDEEDGEREEMKDGGEEPAVVVQDDAPAEESKDGESARRPPPPKGKPKKKPKGKPPTAAEREAERKLNGQFKFGEGFSEDPEFEARQQKSLKGGDSTTPVLNKKGGASYDLDDSDEERALQMANDGGVRMDELTLDDGIKVKSNAAAFRQVDTPAKGALSSSGRSNISEEKVEDEAEEEKTEDDNKPKNRAADDEDFWGVQATQPDDSFLGAKSEVDGVSFRFDSDSEDEEVDMEREIELRRRAVEEEEAREREREKRGEEGKEEAKGESAAEEEEEEERRVLKDKKEKKKDKKKIGGPPSGPPPSSKSKIPPPTMAPPQVNAGKTGLTPDKKWVDENWDEDSPQKPKVIRRAGKEESKEGGGGGGVTADANFVEEDWD